MMAAEYGFELPSLRGRVAHQAPLAATTWFRVGGAAETLIRPADTADLATLLGALPLDTPTHILGAASNVIIRDGGVAGVVFRLARGFADIALQPDGLIAGAGALDATIAEHAAAAGLSGLEFFCGVPGSLGGAIAMNAGAYGRETADCLDWVELVARDGAIHRVAAAELEFGYRRCGRPAGAVVTRARLRATPSDSAAIFAHMAQIRASREASQPVRARTGWVASRLSRNR